MREMAYATTTGLSGLVVRTVVCLNRIVGWESSVATEVAWGGKEDAVLLIEVSRPCSCTRKEYCTRRHALSVPRMMAIQRRPRSEFRAKKTMVKAKEGSCDGAPSFVTGMPTRPLFHSLSVIPASVVLSRAFFVLPHL